MAWCWCLVPPEHKNAGELYESYQVETLRKWAPVRTYYGNLGTARGRTLAHDASPAHAARHRGRGCF